MGSLSYLFIPLQISLFLLAAWGCFALREYYEFQVPHDTGYFSLKTKGGLFNGLIKFDIWHDLERLAGLFIILAVVIPFNLPLEFILYGAVILFAVHFFLYRIVGKIWIKKLSR